MGLGRVLPRLDYYRVLDPANVVVRPLSGGGLGLARNLPDVGRDALTGPVGGDLVVLESSAVHPGIVFVARGLVIGRGNGSDAASGDAKSDGVDGQCVDLDGVEPDAEIVAAAKSLRDLVYDCTGRATGDPARRLVALVAEQLDVSNAVGAPLG